MPRRPERRLRSRTATDMDSGKRDVLYWTRISVLWPSYGRVARMRALGPWMVQGRLKDARRQVEDTIGQGKAIMAQL